MTFCPRKIIQIRKRGCSKIERQKSISLCLCVCVYTHINRIDICIISAINKNVLMYRETNVKGNLDL